MEVLGIVWAVVGGLSLVGAVAEIRNRVIFRAERKKAEAERRAEEERRAKEAKNPWEARNEMYSLYKALGKHLASRR